MRLGDLARPLTLPGLFLVATSSAFAAPAATTTTLAVTVGGNPATTAATRSVVTLTATVLAGAAAASPGQVSFCDVANAAPCTFLHLVGTAQVTAAGTATFRFVPGPGTHTYQAVFVGTKTFAASSSDTSAFSETYPSATTLSAAGASGDYTLTGATTFTGPSPTGSLSLLDNYFTPAYTLATSPLTLNAVPKTFNNAASLSANSYAFQTVAADFNGDGYLDLATTFYGGFQVNLGIGDGTFGAAATTSGIAYAVGLVVIDFNSDGIPDLAVLDQSDNNVTLFQGKGDGTFTNLGSVPAGTGNDAISLTAGDLNHDGIPDLVVVSQTYLTVLLGAGDGTFPTSNTVVDDGPAVGPGTFTTHFYQALIVDIDGDGNPDLVVSNDQRQTYQSSTTELAAFFLALGDGTGTFPTRGSRDPQSYTALPNAFFGLTVGDFNGDGMPDVALAVSSGLGVCLQNSQSGTISFHCAAPYPADSSAASDLMLFLQPGDFNADGSPDLVLFSGNGGADGHATFFQNNHSGAFSELTVANIPSYDFYYFGEGNLYNVDAQPALADFNGDGLPDFVAANIDRSNNGVSANQVFLESTPTFSSPFTFDHVSVQFGSTHTVVAGYLGDSADGASTSATATLTANELATNLTVAATPQTGGTAGKPVAITASIAPVDGENTSANGYTVSFYDSDRSPSAIGTATLANGVAQLNISSLPQGNNHLYATFSAVEPFLAATSNTFAISLGPPDPQVVSWVPSSVHVFSGSTPGNGILDATDSISASIAYTLAVQPSGTPVAIDPSTVLTQGSYLLTAAFTPDDTINYTTATDSIPFSVQNMNVFAGNPSGSVTSLYNGGTVQTFATPGGGIGAAVDPSGYVWSISADGTSLARYSDSGTRANLYPSTGLAAGSNLAIDGNGNLWVTHGMDTVSLYSPAGTLIHTVTNAALSRPSAVAIDTSGNVWIANSTAPAVTELLGGASPAVPLALGTQNANPAAKP